ncbi:MAG: hypothetical protein KC492_38780, partial [Myxococcales bacterium]|nr:hypothetical protein [Myxococcales bacterium]
MTHSKLAYELMRERFAAESKPPVDDPYWRSEPMPDTFLSGLRQYGELLAIVLPLWCASWFLLSWLRVQFAQPLVRLPWFHFWPEALFVVPFLGRGIYTLVVNRWWRFRRFAPRARDALNVFREILAFYGVYLGLCMV